MSNDLLSNGSYGCVYHPGFSCDGDIMHNKKIVTKVQKNNPSVIDAELEISKIVRTIPDYSKFFVPIMKSCKLDIGQIDAGGLKDCKVISGNTRLVMMYLKYIKSVPYNTYILNIIKKPQTKYNNIYCFRQVIKSYIYILNSVSKLLEKEIVHFDLHNNNLIYDINHKLPLIIDFGLSIEKRNLYKFLSKSHFSLSAAMSHYSIEIHLLKYIINNTLTKEKIISTSQQYITSIKDISIINEYYSNFLNEYIKAVVIYYSKFININYKIVVTEIVKYWYTWDNYATGLIILRSFNQMIKKNIINKNNNIVKEIYILIVKTIHPNPTFRLTVDQTLRELRKIIVSNNAHYKSLFH
jgi:tRNA A-37 threonylcarbamoyl transferase component Bud32